MTDLVLYHAPHTRSVRPLWLLEEMELPYELQTSAFDPEYFASDEFRRINPVGQIPILCDGGEIVTESTAILEYLLSRYGPSPLGVDPEDEEYACFLRWLHVSEAGMMHYLAILLGQRIVHSLLYAVSDEFDAYCEKKICEYIGMLDDHLQGRDFLLQRGFSAADISIGYSLFLAQAVLGFTLPKTVEAYFATLRARPAWEKAMAE